MKKKIVFFFAGILLVNNLAMSNDIVNQVRDARNEFEIQQKREEEKKIQELLRAELLRKEEKAKPKIKKMGEKKYKIKQLVLEGAVLLDEKTKQKIASKYIDKKIGMGEIYELVGELTNEYIERGYVTTKVTIPLDQRLADGRLKLKVIPGTIEDIIYNDLSFRDKMKIYMAFPTKKGEYLNLFELEQGISNLNNVVYNNAKMNLVAGSKAGESIVSIENKREFTGINIGYDNLGQKSTGKEKLNLSLRTGDFIGNDSLSINGSKNLDGDDSFKYNKSISASYNIPFGFWDAGVSYSHSKYLTTIPGIVKPIKSSGNSTLTSYKLSRVLGRVGQGKLSFETKLNIKSKKDFINDIKIEVSSRTTSNIKNQLSYVGKVKGGSLYTDLSQTMGLYEFGATKDLNTSSKSPRSDYKKYNLNVRWLKPFFIKKQYFTYEFATGAQYSEDRLYSADQFSLGDDVTVRGYESGVSGENGYYVRNQLTYNLVGAVSGKKSNIFTNTLGKTRVFAGIDYGMTRDKQNKNNINYRKNEELLGMEVGIKYIDDYLNYKLSYSRGLNAPDYIKKSELVNFTVSMGL